MKFEAPGATGLKVTCDCGTVLVDLESKTERDLTVTLAHDDSGWIEFHCECGRIVRVIGAEEKKADGRDREIERLTDALKHLSRSAVAECDRRFAREVAEGKGDG
jgi:hypothetical protein